MRFSTPWHRASLRRLGLFVGLCAAGMFGGAVASSADPVEKLRLAVTSEAGEGADAQLKRKKLVEAAIPELKTIHDLRRGYMLSEWPAPLPGGKKTDLDDLHQAVGAKLIESIRAAAERADLDQQLAAAMWIAELSRAEPVTDPKKEKFSRGMTDIVMGLLKQKDVAVRQAALHALGRMTPNPAEAFPAIKNTLQTDELGPRRLAAYALSDLIKNLEHHNRPEQMEIVDGVVRTAAISLNDSDEAVRGYSLQAILQAAWAFHDSLKPGDDLSVEVKGKPVLAVDLQKILTSFQATSPQLLQALYDPKLNVRLTAMQTLDHINNARSKIVKKFQDLNPEKRVGTKELLKAHEVPDPLGDIVERDWTFIARLLKEDVVELRRGAIEFLELLEDQAAPAIKEITEALRDSDRMVRWSATRAVRNLPPSKVGSDTVRAVGQVALDPDYDLSRSAIATLEALGPIAVDATDSLAFVSADRTVDTDNRIQALRALIAIGTEKSLGALPKLVSALSDPDVRIRRATAETIGRYGPSAKEVLPALRQAMRDEDSEVRLNASEAILSIIAPAKKGL